MVETEIQQGPSEPQTRVVMAELDEGDVQVHQSAIGMVRTASATIGQSAVGAVFARHDVSVSQAGGRLLVAGGDLTLQQGGGGMLVAGGDAEIRAGGVGTLVALGGVSLERGAAVVALTRGVDVHEGGTLGVALAPRVTVHPGGRVLIGAREAGIAGVVGGLVIGMILFVLRRMAAR